MYVTNIKNVEMNNIYKCNKNIGKWLIERSIPVLSIDENEIYYFRDTDLLKEVLSNLPLYLKYFQKGGN